MTEAGDTVLLPSANERTWALKQLTELIAAAGFSRFVLPPLIEPTPTFFPDPWRGGEASVTRLALRLLHYASLDDVEVAVELVDDAPAAATQAQGGVWFAHFDGDICHFGVATAALREPQDLVAAFARATAEAFRARHKLRHTDAQVEARLVDLTSIYLGFGLLAVDAAVRHHARSSGGMQTQRRVSKLGVLGPQLSSFVLGAQLCVRDRPHEWGLVRKHLRANERAFVSAALEGLPANTDELRQQLGIPNVDTWSPAPTLDEFVGGDVDDDSDERDEVRRDVDAGIVGKNRGQPVFRVERSMARRLGYVGLFGTMMLGGVAMRSFQNANIDMTLITAVGVGLGAAGLVLGRFLRESRCSEPQCAASLPADATTCPRCGGTIRGTIDHPKKRLAAAEQLLAAERDQPHSSTPSSAS